MRNKPAVLMFGPAKTATSGISSVVNNWLGAGLEKNISLEYIATLDDYVPGEYIKKSLNALRAYRVFWVKCKAPVDLVHIHLSSGMSFYRKLIIFWFAKRRNIKVAVHLHGSVFKEFYEDGSRFQQRLVSWLFDQSDGIFVLSRHWKSFIEKISSNKQIYIINNGASVKLVGKKSTDPDKIVIAFMGRLGLRKGTYDLLEAFQMLSADIPEARLVLGGDGDINRVRSLVEEKGLSSQVEVLGWVSGDEKTDVFRRADIYALPSYNEGLPGSILEAMAASTPIVSTPVGGIPEAVIESQNGYLIEPGNVNALYLRLVELCQDKELRLLMGKESRRLIEQTFNLEKIIIDLQNAYKEILSK